MREKGTSLSLEQRGYPLLTTKDVHRCWGPQDLVRCIRKLQRWCKPSDDSDSQPYSSLHGGSTARVIWGCCRVWVWVFLQHRHRPEGLGHRFRRPCMCIIAPLLMGMYQVKILMDVCEVGKR